VKTPATADRRGWCFHQPQMGDGSFIFKQLLTFLFITAGQLCTGATRKVMVIEVYFLTPYIIHN
jgi:hypothetical protein